MPRPRTETTVFFEHIIRDTINDRTLHHLQRLYQAAHQANINLRRRVRQSVDLRQRPLDPVTEMLCRDQLLIALDAQWVRRRGVCVIGGARFWSAFAHILILKAPAVRYTLPNMNFSNICLFFVPFLRFERSTNRLGESERANRRILARISHSPTDGSHSGGGSDFSAPIPNMPLQESLTQGQKIPASSMKRGLATGYF